MQEDEGEQELEESCQNQEDDKEFQNREAENKEELPDSTGELCNDVAFTATEPTTPHVVTRYGFFSLFLLKKDLQFYKKTSSGLIMVAFTFSRPSSYNHILVCFYRYNFNYHLYSPTTGCAGPVSGVESSKQQGGLQEKDITLQTF